MTHLLAVRISKIILVSIVAAFAIIVAFNNIVDYGSNFSFVQHVLSMDTTFEGNALMGRAIESSALHHLAYWIIIAMELTTGLLCARGSYNLLAALRQSKSEFTKATTAATMGLTLGLLLWFGGFMVVGAEWFVMWQSDIWNGQQPAFRFATLLLLTLIYLQLPESE